MTLEAKGAGYAYRAGPWAVRDATLEVRPGELLGVIGPNGSGKSTLLRLLAGILPPGAGAVTLGGRPVGALGSEERARRIAFLPQLVQPAFAFTCEEVVAQGRYPRLGAFGFLTARDVALVRASMERTDTAQFAQRPLAALSGGERQRVLLASVLAQQADYLLLDEPTAALDIHHQAEVFSLLSRYVHGGAKGSVGEKEIGDGSERAAPSRQEGPTEGPAAGATGGPLGVAVVVHDLNLAAQYCDRLLLLSVGRIEAEGAPAEVLTQERLLPIYGGNVAVSEHPLIGGPLVSVLTTTSHLPPEPQ